MANQLDIFDKVQRVSFGPGFSIELQSGTRVEVEGLGEISSDGQVRAYDSHKWSEEAPLLVGLIGEPVKMKSIGSILSITAEEKELTIEFFPSIEYEAWQVIFWSGEMYICMPGGEVAHFPPST